MTKLHELLAVETNYQNQASKTRAELEKTFKDKRHLFEEKLVTFKPNGEGATPVVENQSNIQSTIKDEIDWITKILTKAYDASHQIDVANTMAKADLVTEDGHTLLTAVPATSLLRIEHRLGELRELVVAVPTLDPAKGFTVDVARGKNIFRAREINTFRTRKEFKFTVMVPPTKEHPAQIEKYHVDEPIGTIQGQEWSALITPATKADVLDRVDILLRAVKKARARANEQEVEVKDQKIGEKLLGYIFKPLNA